MPTVKEPEMSKLSLTARVLSERSDRAPSSARLPERSRLKTVVPEAEAVTMF